MIYVSGASAEVKQLIKKVFDATCKNLDTGCVAVDLCFVGRAKIRELNRGFRGVDKVTDVLSFPTLSDFDFPVSQQKYPFDYDADCGAVGLGSIVICKAKAAEQAQEYGHSVTREIAFLALHGLLHLCGYDHIKEDDALIMQAKQREILTLLGIER